jgi:hypothetical protein
MTQPAFRMHTLLFGILAVIAGLLSSANAADDSYADIPLAQIPRAVAQAVMKKFPDAQPQSASKGIEDNKPFYDVFIKAKGQKIWVTCNEQGLIETIDREITVKDLPKPVAVAFQKKYPKAAIRLVNEITEGSTAVYDIAITINKKLLIATFSADGGFLEELEDDEPAASAASAK